MRSWQQWLIYVLAGLIPLWRGFTGQTIGLWDHIRPMAGLPVGAPRYPWDVLQADASIQFYPWRDLVFHSWQSFVPPFYNPYQLAGVPLLANSQSGAFYPLHILVGILHFPTSLGLTLLALFHLCLAGMGIQQLALRFGAHPMGALMGGLSFALSPFMLGWTGLASVISTVAWIPWILVAIHELLDKENQDTLKTMIKLALFTGMMVLAGHLQFVAFGALAAGVFAICVAIANRPNLKQIGAAVTGLILGVLLAGPQLKPVLEYSQHSHRKNVPTAEGFAAYQSSAIQDWEFGNLVNPLNLGDPREFAGERGQSTYWPVLVKPGANWTESAVAPGAVVIACLCFLPLVWKRVRHTWPLIAVGVLGFLIAFGTAVNTVLYFGVPGWSSTGSPGRAIVLFLMAAAVIASTVVGNLIHTKEGPPFTLRGAQLCALAFALITFLTFALGQKGANPMPGIPMEFFRPIAGAATAAALITTALVAIIGMQPALVAFFMSRIKPSPNLLAIFPAAAVLIALLTGAPNTVPMGEAIPGPGVMEAKSERVAFANNNWGLTSAAPATMPPNLATIKRELDVSGYDSLLHNDVKEWIKAINRGTDPAPPVNGNIMFVKSNADREKLAASGVKTFDGVVMEGEGRAVLESGGHRISQQVTNQTLRSVSVAVTGGGTLTLRDHNLGGWSASGDGKPLPLKEGPWLTVEVPDGTREVVFSYSPPGLGAGLGMFLFALVALVAAFVFARKTAKVDIQ